MSQLFFTDSVCDNQRATEGEPPPVASYSCTHCSDRAFGTRQALQTHMRVKHGVRNIMRLYASHDCKCQACHTVFSTRLRLLAHLNRQANQCGEWVLTNCAPLPDEEVAALDEIDALARRSAHKAGLKHPKSRGPAVKADGRRVGRVFP